MEPTTTPDVTLCHDGDTITLPAWQAQEHIDLGDPLGECVPIVQVDPPVTEATPVETVAPTETVAPVPVTEVSTVAAPSLAETGLNTGQGCGIAVALLMLGIALVRLSHKRSA